MYIFLYIYKYICMSHTHTHIHTHIYTHTHTHINTPTPCKAYTKKSICMHIICRNLELLNYDINRNCNNEYK